MARDHDPIRGFYSAVAAGGRPSQADYDEMVDLCIDPQSSMSEADLRRELVATTKEILAALSGGRSGDARKIAREATAVLNATLGDLPAPNRNAGKSIRDIVDGIPR